MVLISGPSEYVLFVLCPSLLDAILSMVNIAANMLGAKTEESSEAEGIFFLRIKTFWKVLICFCYFV